ISKREIQTCTPTSCYNEIHIMPSETKYVALLRGINVGGNKLVNMEALKKWLTSLGLRNVKTILATGNVIFETTETDEDALGKKIEAKLEEALGHRVGVLVRPMKEIQKLVKREPFKAIKLTPETRFYVTFLSKNSKTLLKLPYETPEKAFRILEATKRQVC